VPPPPSQSGERPQDSGLDVVGPREAFHRLANLDETPGALELAGAIVAAEHEEDPAPAPADEGGTLAVLRAALGEDPGALDPALERLEASAPHFVAPWGRMDAAHLRPATLHWFRQLAPTALVQGCWLQGSFRASATHTPTGGRLAGLYAHELRARGTPLADEVRAVCRRLEVPLPDVTSRALTEREDLLDESFELPSVLLALAQFPLGRAPEILGLHLSWQFLDLFRFGPACVRDVRAACGLPRLDDSGEAEAHRARGRALAREAVLALLAEEGGAAREQAWARVWRGVQLGARSWARWFDAVLASAPQALPDAREGMLALIRRKAPHAHGFHGAKALGGRPIDAYLDPHAPEAESLLDALARSPWVVPGDARASPLLERLLAFGGPMYSAFSSEERALLARWIDGLPREGLAARRPDPARAAPPRGWTVPRPRASRSEPLAVRTLYHRLLHLERFPEVLGPAERYARDRLERVGARLEAGARPIPSARYDPAVLERWVHQRHREQVDSYRPPGTRPETPRAEFVEATVQLAPLLLIDGAWLRGTPCPGLIQTTIGRRLFGVLYEETGEGEPSRHHANIYREMLAAMGVEAPPVHAEEFARWSRLADAAFEVPAFWLAISCFPRHFMPEILGLNLAVELAGIGGPYLEARDTLRSLGLPTLFVDLHNAADNVSSGHVAQALDAIHHYMDELARLAGPHALDPAWRRVWTGMRSTMPPMGRWRFRLHRLAARLTGRPPGHGGAPIFAS